MGERERRRRPRELPSRDLALLSFLDPRPEERESREDKAREQETDDSLEFSRRGTCGENWGELTDLEKREKGVCSKRAIPAPPPPEGGGEEGARPLATDKCPEALPPLSLDQSRAGGEEAPLKTLGAPRDPRLFPCPPKGREEEEEEVPGSETPKEFPKKGKSKAQKEKSLKGEKMSYTKQEHFQKFPLSHRPKAQDTTCH